VTLNQGHKRRLAASGSRCSFLKFTGRSMAAIRLNGMGSTVPLAAALPLSRRVTGEADDTGLAINTGVVEAVRAGRIARSTVESSYQRILALKARLERLRQDRQ
jgi:hypothetical protein